MINLKKNTVIVFVCLGCLKSPAQTRMWENATGSEVTNAYLKACSWFTNTPSYFLKLKYSSYKDHVSKSATETSEGYYKQVSRNYVTEAMGIKTLQNDNLKLTVDTAERIVVLASPVSQNPGLAKAEEIETLLNGAKTLKKTKLGSAVKYRIDFNKNIQYEAYEFAVNEKGQLSSLVYYYSEQVEKPNDDEQKKQPAVKIKPRLEIDFYSYQAPVKYIAAEFSANGVLDKENGKISLNKAYNNFRLLDYRPQAKK